MHELNLPHLDRPALTVAEVLRLAPVRRGLPEVLAGRDELDRPVRWVHCGEVTDIASLLKGGELLLITGLGLAGPEDDQQRFVADLAARGIAAIALELGRTFEEAPAALVAEAERQSLPLIVLHRGVPFVEITEAVHTEIINGHVQLLRRAEQIHERLTEIMLQGEGAAGIVTALAECVGNPVVLERDEHQLAYYATHKTDDTEVLEAWQSLRGREAATDESFLIAPVPAGGGGTWGRLIAIALESPLDAFDRIAIQQTAAACALSLLQAQQDERLSSRERENFLADLAARRTDGAQARAEALGFQRGDRTLVPVAVRTSGRSELGDETSWGLVWRDVRRELESRGSNLIFGRRSERGDFLVLLGIESEERRAASAHALSVTLRQALARHLRGSPPPVIAVGGAADDWDTAAQGLRDAADATRAAAGLPIQDWHDAARLTLDVLLWKRRADPDLAWFVERQLAALIAHDQSRQLKLLPTLEAYLAHGGRKAETARSLHLERQSLYHRLQRIEEILDVELSDETAVLALHLAIRARHFIDESQQPD